MKNSSWIPSLVLSILPLLLGQSLWAGDIISAESRFKQNNSRSAPLAPKFEANLATVQKLDLALEDIFRISQKMDDKQARDFMASQNSSRLFRQSRNFHYLLGQLVSSFDLKAVSPSQVRFTEYFLNELVLNERLSTMSQQESFLSHYAKFLSLPQLQTFIAPLIQLSAEVQVLSLATENLSRHQRNLLALQNHLMQDFLMLRGEDLFVEMYRSLFLQQHLYVKGGLDFYIQFLTENLKHTQTTFDLARKGSFYSKYINIILQQIELLIRTDEIKQAPLSPRMLAIRLQLLEQADALERLHLGKKNKEIARWFARLGRIEIDSISFHELLARSHTESLLALLEGIVTQQPGPRIAKAKIEFLAQLLVRIPDTELELKAVKATIAFVDKLAPSAEKRLLLKQLKNLRAQKILRRACRKILGI